MHLYYRFEPNSDCYFNLSSLTVSDLNDVVYIAKTVESSDTEELVNLATMDLEQVNILIEEVSKEEISQIEKVHHNIINDIKTIMLPIGNDRVIDIEAQRIGFLQNDITSDLYYRITSIVGVNKDDDINHLISKQFSTFCTHDYDCCGQTYETWRVIGNEIIHVHSYVNN